MTSSNVKSLQTLALLLGYLAGTISIISFIIMGVLHLRSNPITGVVSGYQREGVGDDTSLRTIFTYHVGGRTFEARSIELSTNPHYSIGDPVQLRYSYDRNEWASEDKLIAIYFTPLMTGCAMLLMLGLRSMLIWRAQRTTC